MSTYFDLPYRVDSRDIDLFGQIRPSALLGALQEAATQAAAALEMAGPDVYRKYHAMWVVTRWWVRMDRPLTWGEELTIRTWHRGGTGASSYRDFTLLQNGESVGEAICVWVLVDVDTHRVLGLRTAPELLGTDGGERNRTDKVRRVSLPRDMAVTGAQEMRYSHTDMNGHVNNIHYLDFVCDHLHLEQVGRGKFAREICLCYLSECLAGETIAMETARQGDCLYARGLGADGGERFECSLVLQDT